MLNSEGKYKIPVGSPFRYCKACGVHIYLVESGRRRKIPVDPDGAGHVCLGRKAKLREGA